LVVTPGPPGETDIAAPIQGVVYTGGGRLRSLAFDGSGMVRSWEHRLPGELIARIGPIVVAAAEHSLDGYNLDSGDHIWNLSIPGPAEMPLRIAPSSGIVGVFGEEFWLFDAKSGKPLERGRTSGPRFATMWASARACAIPPPKGPIDLGELLIKDSDEELSISTPDGRHLLSLTPEGKASAFYGSSVFWQGRL
jgi:hypothetical protein